MPPKVSTSEVMAKLGDVGRQAFEAHKTDETEFSTFGELPPGIEGGVAQLTDCEFGIYKKGDFIGKPYFRASAIVVHPKEFNGEPILNKRTQIGPEPICDTPNKTRKTLKDHMAWVLNEIRKMGLDTSRLGFDDLAAGITALLKARPYIKFRTWKPPKQTEGPNAGQESQTKHFWNGTTPWSNVPTPGSGVVDNGSVRTPLPEPDGTELEESPAAFTRPDGEPESAWSASFSEFDDIESLVFRAADEEQARNKLTEMAVGAGFTEEQVERARDWREVGEMIRVGTQSSQARTQAQVQGQSPQSQVPQAQPQTRTQVPQAQPQAQAQVPQAQVSQVPQVQLHPQAQPHPQAQSQTQPHPQPQPHPQQTAPAASETAVLDSFEEELVPFEDTSPAAWEPQEGEVYGYKPSQVFINKKTQERVTKKSENAVQVRITSVNTESQTVALLNLVDKKTVYRNVPWADLESM